MKTATVNAFLAILAGKLSQYDDRLNKKHYNGYRLGHFLEAVSKIREETKRFNHRDDVEAMNALEASILHHFLVDSMPPAKSTIKQIHEWLTNNKYPKYPTGYTYSEPAKSPVKGFREVALYQPGKVFINGKFQTNFTFSYSHQPVDAAAVVLDLCKDGDVIKVKQGRYVWTFKVTRDKGHVRARQTNITPQEKKWSKDHPGFSPRASHRASRPDAIGSLVHKAATKVSRLFQGKR